MDLTQIIGFRGGIRDDLRGTARPHRHAETTLERRYEPQNGGHHGHLSNSLGDLWRNDRLDEHRHVECDCDRDQLSYRWGVHVLSSSGSANVITATATCRLAKGSEGTPVDTGVDALI